MSNPKETVHAAEPRSLRSDGPLRRELATARRKDLARVIGLALPAGIVALLAGCVFVAALLMP